MLMCTPYATSRTEASYCLFILLSMQGMPANISIVLTLPVTRVPGLHFLPSNSIGDLAAFKLGWWTGEL